MVDEQNIQNEGVPKKKGKKKKINKPTLKRKKVTDRTTPIAQWKFPRNSLEEAIEVAKALDEKFAGNPTKAEDLVSAVGFNKVNDWRFQDLLKSGTLYGLTSGSGTTATVNLEKLGEDIIAPSSGLQRQKALLEAFRKVDDFRQVEAFYKGKKIPEDEFFENTLIRQFKIPRDRVKTFIKVFLENMNYLKAFRASGEEQEKRAEVGGGLEQTGRSPESRIEGVREFLDTCFVMMPFGEWFDKYYKEIYIPAIKEAGFEPVRADELFSTGSVVEQIWEQIQKSKVLLADLTGKNPNVFYELGLAHAAKKPVIFTSGYIDDVPFDLRHLRVIIYEVREPGWNNKLKVDITAYLKNAKAEPGKSIPQPFREMK
jgi:hypothetical protein